MKPRDFLEWYRYYRVGGKRMYKNFGILKRANPKAFEKLKKMGKLKLKPIETGTLLYLKEEYANEETEN